MASKSANVSRHTVSGQLRDVIESSGLTPTELGPRWVALPDHRDQIHSIVLEDHDESGMALRAEGEARLR
jgi:hypothetical protein